MIRICIENQDKAVCPWIREDNKQQISGNNYIAALSLSTSEPPSVLFC
jgi:hypothetical protein